MESSRRRSRFIVPLGGASIWHLVIINQRLYSLVKDSSQAGLRCDNLTLGAQAVGGRDIKLWPVVRLSFLLRPFSSYTTMECWPERDSCRDAGVPEEILPLAAALPVVGVRHVILYSQDGLPNKQSDFRPF